MVSFTRVGLSSSTSVFTDAAPCCVAVLLTTSQLGEVDYRQTLRFLRMVRPPMRGYSLILGQGGHNFRTWGHELTQALK